MKQWWPAPAKLNLFLHITGLRPNGYHELQTLFQMLDYGDRIAFEINHNSSQITRVTDLPGVLAEDDLMVKAATLLQEYSGSKQGVYIYLDKKLPMGGGLGGGSSDAATVLLVLNKLWGCGYQTTELAELGMQLGADVPVFIEGNTAWGEGIGERLQPLQLDTQWYLVLKPQVEVSTKELFSSSQLTRDCHPITIADFKVKPTTNVFEPLVKSIYPEVEKALQWLRQYAPARLTGTGACVFAAFNSKQQATEAFQKMPPGFAGFIARGVNKSPLMELLQ